MTQPPTKSPRPSETLNRENIQAQVLRRLASDEQVIQRNERESYRGDMPGGLIFAKVATDRARH